MENIAVCFESSECQAKNIRIMMHFFNFIKLEVTWLDEVAEGLKLIISSADRLRNFFDGVCVDLLWKAKLNSAWEVIVQTMRQACYTLGVVAHQLIAPADEEEENKDDEKKKDKIDLSKLIIMQGGLESRFIPELSDKTKLMIEGFFKITQDDQLRDLALKPAE